MDAQTKRLRGLEIDQKLELGPLAFRFMRPVADVARVKPRARRVATRRARVRVTRVQRSLLWINWWLRRQVVEVRLRH